MHFNAVLALLLTVGPLCVLGQALVPLNRGRDAGASIFDTLDAILSGSQYHNVMFLMDSSGSISDSEFAVSKEATQAILSVVDFIPSSNAIASDKHKIGLVRFSSDANTKVIIKLGEHASFSKNNEEIGKVVKEGGLTNTKKGLLLAQLQLGFRGGSARKQLIWMSTDGMSNEGGDPIDTANSLKGRGVTICVTAIGNSVNHAEIYGMASSVTVQGESRKCVFEVASYSAYDAAAQSARARASARGK
ncbi:uncharacterized protein LOC106180641 [Lingula anatina]|uniref:Uncharacterized protein LOC106180641 n=1 Tax=Lingula anatina TaxID=7574 RepID=A0A1S3KCZ6_LINAN|nr:uncharacterized protein LOC106180641 [Lingula anatina]|eukprot:XP_013420126.1 uncharacterized protein LOC106180641 [Lingula anatina]